MYSKKNLYVPQYPIKLDKPIKQYFGGFITHARAFHGASGWELWGQTPGGGETHLDTKYYWLSPEMPIEWRG